MSPRSLSLVVLCVAAAACRGKLVATAHLSGPGTAEVRFEPKPGLRLWADYDGAWTSGGSVDQKHARMPLKYDVDVVQGGKSIGKIACDTASDGGAKVCGAETTVNGDHDGNCEVSLACSLPTLGAGEVTLRVTGSIADPARVKRVSNMSLNVREP